MAGLSHTSDKLFRAIVSTRNGECLRRGGGLSYHRLRELLLSNWAWTPSRLACIACERVGQQLQLMPGCQIDCSSAMGVGGQSQLRMAT